MYICRLFDCGYGLGEGFWLNLAQPVPVVVPCSDDQTGSEEIELPATAFKTFAETCDTPDGVLAFATKYGLLGCGDAEHTFDEVRYEGESLLLWEAEPVQAWIEHAAALRRAITLWGSLGQKGHVALRSRVREAFSQEAFVPDTLGHPIPPYQPGPQHTPPIKGPVIGAQEVLFREMSKAVPALCDTSKALTTHQKHKLKQWGWVLLGLIVTAQMRGRAVTPDLQPLPSLGKIDDPERPLTRRAMALGFSAHSLLGALWLQLATAISGQYAFRQCEGCGTWLTIHPDEHRSNVRNCDTNCRSKAYRERQRKKAKKTKPQTRAS
jgi:hypothetical protein